MGEDFDNLPFKDKIKDIEDNLSPFSNQKYMLPKIVATMKSGEKESKEYIDKKIEEKMGELIKSICSKEIKMEKSLEIADIFENVGDKKGAESIREDVKKRLKDELFGKKGLFPYLNVKLKFLGISIPIGTLLILGGISYGVWYLANHTDVFKITQKLNSYEATIQTNTKKTQEYSKKTDDFIKKSSDEFNTQKKSIDDSITAHQKSLDEKLSSYSDQILNLESSIDKQSSDFKKDSELYKDSLEKQISNLKNEITSFKESYEKLKADNESYKGFTNETKKGSEETTNKIKELEKKIIESEKKYEKLYKKMNSKK